MNKAQVIEELATRFEGNKKQAQHALESVIDVIQRSLVKGEKVSITGFGAFEKVDRAARTARNPATGASVRVKKTSVPRFRPGVDLKNVVSGKKKLAKAAPAKKTATKSATSRGAAATGTAAKKSAGRAAGTTAAATKTAARSTTKAAASKTTASKRTASKAATASSAPAKRSSATKVTTKRAATKA